MPSHSTAMTEFTECVATFQGGRRGTAIQFGHDEDGDSVQGGVEEVHQRQQGTGAENCALVMH